MFNRRKFMFFLAQEQISLYRVSSPETTHRLISHRESPKFMMPFWGEPQIWSDSYIWSHIYLYMYIYIYIYIVNTGTSWPTADPCFYEYMMFHGKNIGLIRMLEEFQWHQARLSEVRISDWKSKAVEDMHPTGCIVNISPSSHHVSHEKNSLLSIILVGW